jgi:hypothetical protein
MGLTLLSVGADPAQRRQMHAEMRQSLLDFAQKLWQGKDCQRIPNRIVNYFGELVVWLIDPAVPADNNLQGTDFFIKGVDFVVKHKQQA